LTLLHSWRTRLTVLAASTLVLLGGRAIRPAPTATSVPASQERAAPLIASSDVNLGLDPTAAFVTLADSGGVGIAVSEQYVLSNAQALGGRRVVELLLGDNLPAQARLAAIEPATGHVLLEWTEGSPLRPIRLRAESDSPLKTIVDRLTTLAASGRGLPATLGLRLQETDAALAAALGADGVIVSALDPGSPAAGIVRPGDVLIGIDDQPMASVQAAQKALAELSPDTDVSLALRRKGEAVTVVVTAALAFGLRPPLERTSAPTAGEVLTPAQATRAGIDPAARLLRIAETLIAEPGDAQRALRRRSGPALLYLERDGERFFAVLPK
jgi:hypothetical protein